MVKAYYGGVISATPPSVSSVNASGFFNSSEHMQAVNRNLWPGLLSTYKIYADSTYNAQGWVSASTDYIGTTGVFSFSFPGPTGLQSTSGGARTNALPYGSDLKIYFELTVSSGGLGNALIGLAGDGSPGGYSNVPSIYVFNGVAYGGYNVNLNGGGLANGNTLNVAYNSNTGKVFYGRNGVWSIDPVAGAGITIPNASVISNPPRLIIMSGSTASGASLGGTIKTKSGSFSYDVPSGYTTIN
jgi:hypothetical protein